MTTMTTSDMTCGEALEKLSQRERFHQERAEQARDQREMLRSLMEGIAGEARTKATVLKELMMNGAEPRAEPEDEPGPEAATQAAAEATAEATAEAETPMAISRNRETGPGQSNRSKLQDLVGIEVDFEGAVNMRERVRRIAEAAGEQKLTPTVVARFLIASGQHRSTAEYLRPNVYRIFRDQPELYRPDGDGSFQYIRSGAEEGQPA